MITFVTFCQDVLGLALSPAWRVLLLVSVDGVEPATLNGADQTLARQLFGDLDEVPDVARRTLVWRLGRGSGKSTIAAAYGIYAMVTGDCTGVGAWSLPIVAVVSPSLAASKRLTRAARELVRRSRIEKYVSKSADAVEGFEVSRPDGRRISFMSVAASRGGHTLRGPDVLAIIFDESEFLNSSSEVASADVHVSDRDLLAAVAPRLLGKALFISTPWPAPNMTGELVAENHGNPTTALVAIGPSTMMRPDDTRLSERVEIELRRDRETARREFFCEAIEGGGKFFDVAALELAITRMPPQRTSQATCVAACDLGFVRDASALVILERRANGTSAVVHCDTVRPTKGSPIVPSILFQRFAPAIIAHGCNELHSDSFNAASVREIVRSHGITLQVHTESRDTKSMRYIALRDTIAHGRILLPNDKRLIDGLKSIVGRAQPGGAMAITAPRRAGSGHADAVSALVLAHHAMNAGAAASNLHDEFQSINARLRAVGAGRHYGGFGL